MRDPVLFLLKSLAKLRCTFRRADLYFVSTVLFQLKDRLSLQNSHALLLADPAIWPCMDFQLTLLTAPSDKNPQEWT